MPPRPLLAPCAAAEAAVHAVDSSGMLGGNQRTDKLTAPNMNSPILVTGASQRVGLALALELAQAGHTVVSASRSVQPQAAHPNIVQFQPTCAAADRRALIDYLHNHYNGLRAIIHNASLWLDDGLDNLETMFRLHVEAPYHLNPPRATCWPRWKRPTSSTFATKPHRAAAKATSAMPRPRPRCRTWCCRSPKNMRPRCM